MNKLLFKNIMKRILGGLPVAALVLLLFALSSYAAHEGLVPQWTAQTGTAESDFGKGTVVDSTGSFYVVGHTSGAFAGFSNAGGTDIAVTKYTSSGTFVFALETGTVADDFGFAVAADTAGFVYIAGSTFGGLNGTTNAGGADAFVMQYSSTGIQQWVFQFGTAQDDEAFGIAVSSGSIYAAGYSAGTLTGPGNAGGKDIFLVKLNSAGAAQWAVQTGTSTDDVAHAVSVDADGAVYVAGFSSGSLGGNISAGGTDIVLLKFAPAGTALWTRQLGSTQNDDGVAVAVSTDSVLVAGRTAGSIDGNTSRGGTDAVVAKFSLSGTKVWTQQFGTPQDDRAAGVAVTRSGIFAAGSTAGGLDGAVNGGSSDIFLTQFDTAGNRLTSRQMATGALDSAQVLGSDHAGGVFMAGYTGGGLNGNTNQGKEDIFLIRFTTTTVPFLQWTGEQGYTSGGVQPLDSVGTANYVYRVKYVDIDNFAPLTGYPRVHLLQNGSEIAGSPFTMTSVTPGATTYADGIIYTYTQTLPVGSYAYYFEAFDLFGNKAVGVPTNVNNGPTYKPPEATNVRIYHGVFKPGEGETCTLSYELDRSGEIGVTLYDSLGRQLRIVFRGTAAAGTNTVVWDGRDSGGALVASGVYILRIEPGGKKMKKAVVIR